MQLNEGWLLLGVERVSYRLPNGQRLLLHMCAFPMAAGMLLISVRDRVDVVNWGKSLDWSGRR